jgi:hypothetical protein
MNPFKIIWLKAAIATLIPSLVTLTGAFALYENTGLPAHAKIFLCVTFGSAAIAGLSALSSFLSTTFAEHKAQQQAGLDDSDPAPITAAQIATSPTTVSVPTQPAATAAQPKV